LKADFATNKQNSHPAVQPEALEALVPAIPELIGGSAD